MKVLVAGIMPVYLAYTRGTRAKAGVAEVTNFSYFLSQVINLRQLGGYYLVLFFRQINQAA